LILASFILNEDFRIKLLTELKETIKLKQLEKMIPSFVDLFNHKGVTVSVIQHFVSDEIKNSKTFGTLFRGNSFASKLIKDFIPTNCLAYLKTVFEDLIKKIVSENKDVEVIFSNHHHLHHFLLSEKKKIDPEKEENKKVNVTENLNALLKLTNQFLENILNAAQQMPLSLRLICNTLAESVQEKYGEQQKALGFSNFFFFFIHFKII
jgi:hypothetical protein